MDSSAYTVLAKDLPLVDVVSERVGMGGAVDEKVVPHWLLDIDIVCFLEWDC
jgi:hypothetical protein